MKDTGVLEGIIKDIQEHDRLHPDHGIGCACHDAYSGRIRRLFQQEGLYENVDGYNHHTKSLRNLMVVFHYIQNNP